MTSNKNKGYITTTGFVDDNGCFVEIIQPKPDSVWLEYDPKGEYKLEIEKQHKYLNILGYIRTKLSEEEIELVNKIILGKDTMDERLDIFIRCPTKNSLIETYIIYYNLHNQSRLRALAIKQHSKIKI